MKKKRKNKPFSTKIDPSLFEKLKKDLIDQGFDIKKGEYMLFSARKSGIVCNLYTSGKLVVQGKEKDEFIEFYLEPYILKDFSYTNPKAFIDTTPKIGVDEAGKGDFFGPLCVVSLYADSKGIERLIDLGVSDSKKLKDSSVLKLAQSLKKEFKYSSVTLFPEKYNELYRKFKNLNYLLAWAHAASIDNLHKKTSAKKALIDQFAKKSLVESALSKREVDIDLTQEHRAESDPVVAAASIVARANFLEGLESISKDINHRLIKGASERVLDAGVEIAMKMGIDFFEKIAKVHFKTLDDIKRRLKNM